MNLTIDVGNTRSKVGVFKGKQLVYTTVWSKNWSLAQLKALIKKKSIERVALSTVAGLSKSTKNYLDSLTYYIQLSDKTPLPIKNAYKTPKTLGRDRLAAVVGAFSLFPNEGSLAIDAGTCITYDLIDQNATYQGGNITPGIDMRFKAMHSFTAALPLVKRRHTKKLVGQHTNGALRTGGQWGSIFEMDGFIRQYQQQYGPLQVLITGGSAEYFANQLKTKIFVCPNLVLIGLNEIINHNVKTHN